MPINALLLCHLEAERENETQQTKMNPEQETKSVSTRHGTVEENDTTSCKSSQALSEIDEPGFSLAHRMQNANVRLENSKNPVLKCGSQDGDSDHTAVPSPWLRAKSNTSQQSHGKLDCKIDVEQSDGQNHDVQVVELQSSGRSTQPTVAARRNPWGKRESDVRQGEATGVNAPETSVGVDPKSGSIPPCISDSKSYPGWPTRKKKLRVVNVELKTSKKGPPVECADPEQECVASQCLDAKEQPGMMVAGESPDEPLERVNPVDGLAFAEGDCTFSVLQMLSVRACLNHVQGDARGPVWGMKSSSPVSDCDVWRAPRKIEKRQKPVAELLRQQVSEPIVPGKNSWILAQRGEKDDGEQKILRDMKGLLNKLTIEKFDMLFQKLCTMGISKEDHLFRLVGLIFEKAISQHHFIDMYADLCKRLVNWLAGLKAADPASAIDDMVFRASLMDTVQAHFEKCLKPLQVDESTSKDEKLEAMVKYKLTVNGNAKFVGKLLVLKLISSKILNHIAQELFAQKEEHCFEALCSFFHVVGPSFDNGSFRYWYDFRAMFDKIQHLIKEDSLPLRIKCLLNVVLDLREAQWKLGKEQEGPTSLAQVAEQQLRESNLVDIVKKRQSIGHQQNVRESENRQPIRPGGFEQWNGARPDHRAFPNECSGKSWGKGRPQMHPKKPITQQCVPVDQNDGWTTIPKQGNRKSWSSVAPSFINVAAKSQMIQGSANSEASGQSSEQSKRPMDPLEFVKTLKGVLRELRYSQDSESAFDQMSMLELNLNDQAAAFSAGCCAVVDLSGRQLEQSLELLVRLCSEGVFAHSTFAQGLDYFISTKYEDVKPDVPMLHTILTKQFIPMAETKGLIDSDGVDRWRCRLV